MVPIAFGKPHKQQDEITDKRCWDLKKILRPCDNEN